MKGGHNHDKMAERYTPGEPVAAMAPRRGLPRPGGACRRVAGCGRHAGTGARKNHRSCSRRRAQPPRSPYACAVAHLSRDVPHLRKLRPARPYHQGRRPSAGHPRSRHELGYLGGQAPIHVSSASGCDIPRWNHPGTRTWRSSTSTVFSTRTSSTSIRWPTVSTAGGTGISRATKSSTNTPSVSI